MRSTLAAAMATFLTLTPAALAERLVVVELFTSQGCSSCPPADALLGELSQQGDVLPLAFHVDYWDYIGWKDEFADPAHTERQRGYARAAGARSIYTPQMVIGGLDHVIGYKPMKVAMLIDKHEDAAAVTDVKAVQSSGNVTVSVSKVGRGSGPCRVLLVSYDPHQKVSIRRGENAGKTLSYHNIVTGVRDIGRWDGKGTFKTSVPATGDAAYAVIVQSGVTGPIVGAAKVR